MAMLVVDIVIGAGIISTTGITVAQLANGNEVIKVGSKLAEMSAVSLLGIVAVGSLLCTWYLAHFIGTRLMRALEENTKASQRVSDSIERCIHNQRG